MAWGVGVLTLAVPTWPFHSTAWLAAVSVTDRLWLVDAGWLDRVIALRPPLNCFLRWLEVYCGPSWRRAGYLAVGLVGLRLLTASGAAPVRDAGVV